MPNTPLILVCDDEAHIRAIIVAKLRSAGYDVAEARDGREALQLAESHPPVLVITDFQMPYISGIELATRLRATPATHETPVLMLTARGYVIAPDQVAKTNIVEVMGKPFGVRQLLAKVQSILTARGLAFPRDESKPLAA